MRIYLFIFLLMTTISCSRVDKNPELRDPVYSDIQSEIGTLKTAIDLKIKEIDGFKLELKDVVPQSGQIKYVQKRLYEAQGALTRMEQELLFFELKRESQIESARRGYHRSLKDNSIWPDPKEYGEYLVEKRFRRASKTWNARDRMEELKISDPAVSTAIN